MDRPIRDIQRHIDYVGTLVDEEPDPKIRWKLQQTAATCVWQRDSKAYCEAQGAEFFDYEQWRLDKAYADSLYREAAKRYRKRQGDKQILTRLDELVNAPREEDEYKITRARRKVIRAVVGLAASSGVLYCGYDGLARAAGVSPRSACSIRAELEHLGVLERIRTGGMSEGGARQSNKYIVVWNVLRVVLGISCSYATEWRVPERSRLWNVFYNYHGYAHYSKSERQKRRERQRAREHARAVMARADRAYVDNRRDVENSAPDEGPDTVKDSENDHCEQGFCALTALKDQKTPKIFQPVRSLLSYCRSVVKKCTPLRGSSNARPEGGMPESLRDTLENRPAGGSSWCFNVSEFAPSSLSRLSHIAPERILPLLNEIDQMTRQNPILETQEDMQWHAESLLHLLADADKIHH